MASQPSKEAVNRAGRLIASLLVEFRQGNDDEIAQMETSQEDEIDAAFDLIDWWRSLHAKPLTSVSANLRHYLKPHGPVVVTQRLKRFPTVVDKLLREPTMNLTQMADIGGCRALLWDQEAVYAVARRLRRNWEVERTRDYAAEPKTSGYRAVHLIVRRKGRLIEVQLRTPLQDAWANQVEEDSRRVGRNFKGGEGQSEVHGYYAVVSELLALRERDVEPDEDLRQRLLLGYRAAQPFLTNDSGGKR
ncbi:MAG TPA: RelA/SpoT domain-containing protein [Solirubrobacteraceae bacterium]|nr:RelA/SpoT domain-containing protein [Solirubrobacteraceae bacterium]